jgi:hypothetical protein
MELLLPNKSNIRTPLLLVSGVVKAETGRVLVKTRQLRGGEVKNNAVLHNSEHSIG